MEGQTSPSPQFQRCEACGSKVFWDNPLLELELAPDTELRAETDQESDTDSETKRNLEVETANSPAGSIENEVGSQFVAHQAEQGSSPDWSVLGPIVSRQRPREISAIRKIIPAILGGLAAFPIATLIMWYVVGQDIGSAGPTVAKYVPWIVPQKLRASPWKYSRNSEPSDSSRSLRSLPLPRASLPKLDRQDTIEELSETSDEQSDFPPNEAVATKGELPLPVDEDTVKKASISETIAKLRELQKEWNPNTPLADRDKLVGELSTTIKRLSEQAAKLKGPSLTIWRKELEAIAREILAHPKVPVAIQFGSIGKLPGIPPALPGDFIATVIKIGDKNSPAQNKAWILKETWSTAISEISIEVMPGAWRDSSAPLPLTCLILGKLVADETYTGTVLKAHAILPE
ncbi:MAG TPA: hypothetical protein VM260_13605 [Pirellula sp.]|nr:hypothetical protein [Pirellula sp.]